MVKHIVMWKFKDNVPETDRPALKQAMKTNLEGLVGQVPGLISLRFVETPLSNTTHDMALVSSLEKPSDISVYASHPAHVHVADTYVRPYVTDRACLDYEEQ